MAGDVTERTPLLNHSNQDALIVVTTSKDEQARNVKDSPIPERKYSAGNSNVPSNRNNGSSKVKCKDFRTGSVVTFCILLTEACERLAYNNVTGSMVLYCTDVLLFSSADAVNINMAFVGTSFFIPLLGGWFADSMAGRYNTIYGSMLVYVAGLLLIIMDSLEYTSVLGAPFTLGISPRRAYYVISIVFIAVGNGGMKPNIAPFGAQQVEQRGSEAVNTYFSLFYWFLTVGSALGVTVTAYMQQEFGFSAGYVIAAAITCLSLVLFAAARNSYITTPPAGSVAVTAFKIVLKGVRNKFNSKSKKDSILDYAKIDLNEQEFTMEDIDGLHAVSKTIPVFLCLMCFALIYVQATGTFVLQGVRMNLRIGTIILPAISLNVIIFVIVMILIPILDRMLFPLLSTCGRRPTLLQRIGAGLVCCGCGAICAGILELIRKQELRESGGIVQLVGQVQYNASTISALWQIPQYTFLGAGEALTLLTAYEFAFTEVSPSLQSITSGIYLLCLGLGIYFGTLLVTLIQIFTVQYPWIPVEINEGYLENFFFLLGGIMAVNICAFLIVANRYEYSSTPVLSSEKCIKGSNYADIDI